MLTKVNSPFLGRPAVSRSSSTSSFKLHDLASSQALIPLVTLFRIHSWLAAVFITLCGDSHNVVEPQGLPVVKHELTQGYDMETCNRKLGAQLYSYSSKADEFV